MRLESLDLRALGEPGHLTSLATALLTALYILYSLEAPRQSSSDLTGNGPVISAHTEGRRGRGGKSGWDGLAGRRGWEAGVGGGEVESIVRLAGLRQRGGVGRRERTYFSVVPFSWRTHNGRARLAHYLRTTHVLRSLE